MVRAQLCDGWWGDDSDEISNQRCSARRLAGLEGEQGKGPFAFLKQQQHLHHEYMSARCFHLTTAHPAQVFATWPVPAVPLGRQPASWNTTTRLGHAGHHAHTTAATRLFDHHLNLAFERTLGQSWVQAVAAEYEYQWHGSAVVALGGAHSPQQ